MSFVEEEDVIEISASVDLVTPSGSAGGGPRRRAAVPADALGRVPCDRFGSDKPDLRLRRWSWSTSAPTSSPKHPDFRCFAEPALRRPRRRCRRRSHAGRARTLDGWNEYASRLARRKGGWPTCWSVPTARTQAAGCSTRSPDEAALEPACSGTWPAPSGRRHGCSSAPATRKVGARICSARSAARGRHADRGCHRRGSLEVRSGSPTCPDVRARPARRWRRRRGWLRLAPCTTRSPRRSPRPSMDTFDDRPRTCRPSQ